MIRRFYTPGMYHGWNNRKVFFEGWYYKLISADKSRRLAVIPGIFLHPDPRESHAFIQVLDGITSDVKYHRYPTEAFQPSRRSFMIRVADSVFHHEGIELKISGEGQTIEGTIKFENLQPWPVRLLSPGVMGPYRFAPFMQTYHGILSLDHSLHGGLTNNGQIYDFNGGRGYIEKDWGRTFPRAYIWMQSNHFQDTRSSLTASVATIPWLGSWFRGFLIGLLVEGKLYRFTTYLGSEINELSVNDSRVIWITTGKSVSGPDSAYPAYQLIISAQRGAAGLLKSPELDGMTPRIFESLTAKLEVTLMGLSRDGTDQEVLFQGEGDCGGLEIAGSIEEIISGSQEQT